jgi:Glycosyltransferase family 28 C-terminal domain
MKTIAYYISDYGYGHASRSIAIVRGLLTNNQELRVVICHSFALAFIKGSLSEFGDRIIFHCVHNDVGYVLKKHSLQVDTDKIEQQLKDFLEELTDLAKSEASTLKDLDLQLIITDISFLGIEVADKLNVPVFGISNFTWYTAYQGMLENLGILHRIKSSYDKMTNFYALASSDEPWEKQQLYTFISRDIDDKEVREFKQLFNPNGNKNIIFMPIGLKIDIGNVSDLPIWNEPNSVFVVSQNMKVEHSNVFHIPPAYNEVQNVVAASDLVITKAGWGTCAEAVIAGVPLLLIKREEFTEDQNTTNALVRENLAIVTTWEDLYKTNFSKIIQSYKPLKTYNNDVDRIIDDLLHFIR